MNLLIVKVLAVGLTISQLFSRPVEQFKPAFNAKTDQAEITKLLNTGCDLLLKEFKADSIDFDPLFKIMIKILQQKAQKMAKEASTEPDGKPDASGFLAKLTKQLDVGAMQAAYNQFCKLQPQENSPIKLEEVVDFYNKAFAEPLPDATTLKGMKLKEASVLKDINDQTFTEVYADDNRRKWVPLSELPAYVKNAFIAAEDQNFPNHEGIDLRGIVRAFQTSASSLSDSGDDSSETKERPQGGSTITQQVVKNLLLNNNLTFERKMREMVLARKLNAKTNGILTKDETIELYINFVFLGRASWGVEMAAQSYFKKSARVITVAEAAMLAALTKGPNFYHPDRYPSRIRDRRAYVLKRMKEDKYINDEEFTTAMAAPLETKPFEPPRTKGGFHFVDEINRQVKRLLKIPSLTQASYTVYTTLHSELQKATDRALQDGLYNFEIAASRHVPKGAQGSIAKQIEKYDTTWQQVMPRTRSKLFDVQWPIATVVQNTNGVVLVGLADGRKMPLSGNPKTLAGLKLYDLVHVSIAQSKKSPRATLRSPTDVQGAVVVIENRTGRVLAMSGGFSYAGSQLNRVTQTFRQTGSTLKPFIYLSALQMNFQPNTLIPDIETPFPSLQKVGQTWTPKNYDGGTRGLVTMRQAIEKSLNLPTARMMAAMGPPGNPAMGLDWIQGITKELGIYREVERVYPFVLGAQPARLIDMAIAYATVANDGLKPRPHFIDKLVKDGQVLYERKPFDSANLSELRSVDRVSFYQLRRILEGTVSSRGTGARLQKWQGKIAGKTGTSNREMDAWFVGFSNKITVAVWVGYDNEKTARTLGGFTGGRVALPIAEKIFEASFKLYDPLTPLVGAPPAIQDQIVEVPVDGVNASSGIDVFRTVGPKSRRAIDSRVNILTAQEQGMDLYKDPMTEADDTVDFLRPDEVRMATAENTPQSERYEPGVEDSSEMWERNNRQVDPVFSRPIHYRGQ